MKRLSARANIGLVLSLAATGVIACVVYAQDNTSTPTPTPSANDSIHLVMGGEKTEPLHVTEESLTAALAALDALDPAHPGKAYRVQYWVGHQRKWEKGNKTEGLFPVGNLSPSPHPGPVSIFQTSGSHSTQDATFTSTAINDHALTDLKKFVNTLVAAPTPTPTPKPPHGS